MPRGIRLAHARRRDEIADRGRAVLQQVEQATAARIRDHIEGARHAPFDHRDICVSRHIFCGCRSHALAGRRHHEHTPDEGGDMRFLMQIFQGEALEAWSRLSEEEQQGIAADYAALNETPGVTPGRVARPARRGDDRAGPGRRGRHHRWAVRGDEGGARRLLPVRGRRPRCGHRRRCHGAGNPLRRRCRDPAARPVLVGDCNGLEAVAQGRSSEAVFCPRTIAA